MNLHIICASLSEQGGQEPLPGWYTYTVVGRIKSLDEGLPALFFLLLVSHIKLHTGNDGPCWCEKGD
ncbi:hypothetical protein O3P69_002543 [Scylla paramamosain]|uniref:Uncharacterized protein n=1 Tax=Scylla paramamosain TaxID=85552 RepID=A0AAW0UNM7_SCYPA